MGGLYSRESLTDSSSVTRSVSQSCKHASLMQRVWTPQMVFLAGHGGNCRWCPFSLVKRWLVDSLTRDTRTGHALTGTLLPDLLRGCLAWRDSPWTVETLPLAECKHHNVARGFR
jgi:hypothetical protein